VVALEHISKTFPGTKALDDVSIEIAPGTIHALLGENGSGKSTAVKVLAGAHQPDSGTVVVGGRRLDGLSSPAEAGRAGIRALHQEAPLIGTLTVAECVALFHHYPQGLGWRVRWRTLMRETRALLEELDIPVDPRTLAAQLTPIERTQVGLAIVLGRSRMDTQLLVLDEATAALPEGDAESFLARVAEIAGSGLAVLMVTHRLRELAFADRLTVLRNGRVVFAAAAEGQTDDFLVAQMVGDGRPAPASGPALADGVPPESPIARFWSARPGRAPTHGAPALQVDGLSASVLRDLSFTIAPGEIVGAAGLRDSGVQELPLVLAGAQGHTAGSIRVDGAALGRRFGPRQALAAGIALVPGDRLNQGGVRSLSVRDNVVLPEARRYWHRRARESRAVEDVIETFDVRPRSPDAQFGQLSGGNQQKVILGKWLLLRPRVLILDDPTYGVDPGARREIFRALRVAAGQGIGILMLSTEPEQLVALCQRVMVLRGGSIATELRDSDLNLQTLTRWCWA
jgi:ribose transport system ATP-binding protein